MSRAAATECFDLQIHHESQAYHFPHRILSPLRGFSCMGQLTEASRPRLQFSVPLRGFSSLQEFMNNQSLYGGGGGSPLFPRRGGSVTGKTRPKQQEREQGGGRNRLQDVGSRLAHGCGDD